MVYNCIYENFDNENGINFKLPSILVGHDSVTVRILERNPETLELGIKNTEESSHKTIYYDPNPVLTKINLKSQNLSSLFLISLYYTKMSGII